jgi:replicative DNA helicase
MSVDTYPPLTEPADPWADEPGYGPQIPQESHDADAERQVIGAMLTFPAIIGQVAAEVSADEFYTPKLATLAQIIFDLDRERVPVDALAVIRELSARGLAKQIHGAEVFSLTNAVVVAGAAPSHARVVRHHAQLRQVGVIGRQLLGLSRATHIDDLPEALGRARDLLEAAEAANPAQIPATAGEKLESTLGRFEKRAEEAPDMGRSGLRDLDDRFRGFKAGQVTIIAGRPGTGKSLLGLCIARATSMTMQAPVLIASMEMTDDEIMDRLVCAESRTELTRAEENRLDEADWSRIAAVLPRIAKANLRIDDAFEMTLDYLRNLVRTLRRGPGCDLLVVDYLQLITPPRGHQTREQAIGAISRGLKGLAKEFRIPVVALAQINRESEKRIDKTPVMSDLRESGSLEQDADNIILLHRPELYGEENRTGEIDLIVAKQRSGPRFTATAAFQGHKGRLADMAKPDWTPHSALGGA